MSRSAVECLDRGWRNVWANWELLLLSALGQLAVGILVVLGLVVPFLALGLNLFTAFVESARGRSDLGEWWMAALERLTTAQWEWAVALAALLLCWGAASIVYGFLQAGLVGVLDQGEATAEAAAEAAGRTDRLAFRVVSWAGFVAWGQRFLWPFLGLMGLWGAFLLIALLPLLLGLVAALTLVDDPGNGPLLACGGCALLLFTFVVSLVISLWYFVAQAELVQPGTDVFTASRRALGVLVRRPWAILLFLVLWVAAAVAVSIVTLPISGAASFMLPNELPTQLLFQLVLSLVQSLLGLLPQLLFLGAIVALVRGESAAPRSVVVTPVVVTPAEVSIP